MYTNLSFHVFTPLPFAPPPLFMYLRRRNRKKRKGRQACILRVMVLPPHWWKY
ncbi:uncharacterized protein BO96DRAFT_103376 [Aspergillus niger CBS 101883]|uniref:uncharacterized protein n=1 Tax=Aspergillus lacticoffeatus (strain CBS 101883) TaxID=1450533 RepID=UPI000D7EE7B4|nr:uncharacterized protein BO96DRAFT_103376 [Aspergillus niger CBS 101883]PYH54634.1 hypothetical protein BO96DRAFT_103376 [Aspergillus niger CBS 101883]